MIKTENHMGTIEINETYFANLIGNTVSSCFGVVGMANSNTRQQLRAFLKKGLISPIRVFWCRRPAVVCLSSCT